jgi:ATP-dependent DNA helicase RecG
MLQRPIETSSVADAESLPLFLRRATLVEPGQPLDIQRSPALIIQRAEAQPPRINQGTPTAPISFTGPMTGPTQKAVIGRIQGALGALFRNSSISPEILQEIEQKTGSTLLSLITKRPTRVSANPASKSLSAAIAGKKIGKKAIIAVRVLSHIESTSRKYPHKIVCQTDVQGQRLEILFWDDIYKTREFCGSELRKDFPIGGLFYVQGRLSYSVKFKTYGLALPGSRFPEDAIVGQPTLAEFTDTVIRHYKTIKGLSSKQLSEAIDMAIRALPEFPEWIDPSLMERTAWPSFKEALIDVHTNPAIDHEERSAPAYHRLAFEEMAGHQIRMQLVRMTNATERGWVITTTEKDRADFLSAIPYALTPCQAKAINEIDIDLAGPTQLKRLLQGDVGAGKTIVALRALFATVRSRYQGALIAPTEILARQHFTKLAPIAAQLGIKMALLTGGPVNKAKASIIDAIKSGEIDIAVGTHSLLQDAVTFRRLGLAVFDEQHRFGVEQRTSLEIKNEGVNQLAMTATPIPRSVHLTMFGDLDCSILASKPPGRQPIATVVLDCEKIPAIYERLGALNQQGQKAYWVCARVSDGPKSKVTAVTQRYEDLVNEFGDRVALIHGQMTNAQKEEAMARFTSVGPDAADILCATTIIEVGVDVPIATVMIIENAERFGLATLHQMRGRVGRGAAKSACVLLHSPGASDESKARLEQIRSTEDGFLIAEYDLETRGAGESLGTRQSGEAFNFADLFKHKDLAVLANNTAKKILSEDPTLSTPESAAIRQSLSILEKDDARFITAS